MLEIKNLTKTIGKNKIIKNINIKIKKGECVGILGSNGAGKTTLMELIVGQIKPTSGEILIDGEKNTYKKVGIQFQEGSWPMGVNSKILIKFFKSNWFKETDEITKELIKIFEIEEILKKDLNNLSGGQKQRINTFLAVINNPEYIFLDEMVTGLDLKMQLKLLAFFKKLKSEGKTIIVISHIPEEVEELCDRVIILKKGEIYIDKTTSEIIKTNGSVRKLLIDYYDSEDKEYAKKIQR
ncbi:ATP-binding cassette domain-containing protein [Spiroplasma monobiae]|uniref:ABC transporter ATP-binding protein n=1 Tax=Spiroplasma monobiae MQ-1 TaxID=1336748 RepID=A0A2K9LW93_SPISQ|nr:ABC transporter ATP-binding protein [Spiroplasma monobiae]AUM62655.1 ABC transporter ATP-binding protein [Spiroplasma monobiae MQ-1]